MKKAEGVVNNGLPVGATFVYDEKSKTWVNMSICKSVLIKGRDDYVQLLAFAFSVNNENVENTMDPCTQFGIVFSYSKGSPHYIDGFRSEGEAIEYLSNMMDNAKVLGVPNE